MNEFYLLYLVHQGQALLLYKKTTIVYNIERWELGEIYTLIIIEKNISDVMRIDKQLWDLYSQSDAFDVIFA